MPRLIGPTRLLLTVMLAAAIPLCCCRGEMLASLLGGEPHKCTVSHATADHGHTSHGHSHQHGSGHGKSGCGHDAPEPCNDEGPCDCAHQGDIKSLPDAPTSVKDSGGVLVTVLPELSVGRSGVPLTNFRLRRLSEAVPRPPTSLLRQHCALIV